MEAATAVTAAAAAGSGCHPQGVLRNLSIIGEKLEGPPFFFFGRSAMTKNLFVSIPGEETPPSTPKQETSQDFPGFGKVRKESRISLAQVFLRQDLLVFAESFNTRLPQTKTEKNVQTFLSFAKKNLGYC